MEDRQRYNQVITDGKNKMSRSIQYNVMCEKDFQGKPSFLFKQIYTLSFLSQQLQRCVVKEAKVYISSCSTSRKTNFCIHKSIGVLTSRVEVRSHTLYMYCSLASFSRAGQLHVSLLFLFLQNPSVPPASDTLSVKNCKISC